MSTSILATKLYVPTLRQKIVQRSRLIERLTRGLNSKLTLISAPAGFGKTTLTSEWIASCSRPTAWLSLDEKDNDPVRFLNYLVAALQTVSVNIGEGMLGMLQSAQSPSTESMLTALLNDLSALTERFILVLDDYHVIDAKPVDDVIAFLIDHLPPQMHLVITTREDPRLPLSRLRAQGQLNEIRATDLRFNTSETAGFLNQGMGLNLSDNDVLALETRTEGWIAGLQLAAISMQGHKDTTNFIKTFTGSHHFVMDYLVEEVLQQLPNNLQSFLLRTSILDRLCGPLCDALMLDPSVSGQETLEYLQQANLFVICLDNERQWYRYHHLFSELLRQRLQQHINLPDMNGKNGIDVLQINASKWYENKGMLTEAYHYAAAAKDFERSAYLLELINPEMEGNYQSSTWMGWLKKLPEEMIRIRPVLCVGYAWALLDSGELEEGKNRLRVAEQLLAKVEDKNGVLDPSTTELIVVDEKQFRSLPASIATAQSYYAQALGDTVSTIKYAQKALDILPNEDYLRRGMVAGLLGLAYWSNGDLEESHISFANCMSSLQKAGKIVLAISTTTASGGVRIAQGYLQKAKDEYEKSIQLAAEYGEFEPVITADLHLGLSLMHCERGNLATAIQCLQKSKELSEHASSPDWQYRWYLAQASIKESQKDLKSALEILHKAEHIFIRTPLPDIRPVAALMTRIWIRQGKIAEALEWVEEQGLSFDDDLSYLREFEYITLVRVLIAKYKNDHSDHHIAEAKNLLGCLLKAAEKGKRRTSVIEILNLQAMIHNVEGNESLAIESLEKALLLAEPEQYVRIFVNEDNQMRKLLSKVTANEINPDYVRRLLAGFEQDVSENTIHSTRGTFPLSQPLVEPLSQREFEVLQLISEGLSNDEICKRLFLALSTVKGHNRNIFGKLAVQRRTEAVARAKELNLL
jgi:LuxR family transcriptional regulator, maltose regulon positive regulatory protein